MKETSGPKPGKAPIIEADSRFKLISSFASWESCPNSFMLPRFESRNPGIGITMRGLPSSSSPVTNPQARKARATNTGFSPASPIHLVATSCHAPRNGKSSVAISSNRVRSASSYKIFLVSARAYRRAR